MIRSIAGIDVGDDKHTVIRWDDKENKVVAKWRVADRNVYVKKCKRPEEIEDTGIIRPEKSRGDNTCVQIIAVGERVGLPFTEEEREKYKDILDDNMCCGYVCEIEPGQMWVGPDNHVRQIIQRSPHEEKDEFFINSQALLFQIEE
jgi:hypothetical protein